MTVNGAWPSETFCERDVRARVPAFAVLVVQHRVAMHEGAAARVLAGEAHRDSPTSAATRTPGARPCPSRASARRAPIFARSATTFSTSGCGLKLAGSCVMRAPMRFSSAIGTAVSAESVHLRFRNGIQSTAYLLLKFDSTGSTVCLPASIAARKPRRRIARRRPRRCTPCATSLSAYSLRVPGMLGDLLVHQRLRQRRRVLLVVAELAEADDVDHDVLA